MNLPTIPFQEHFTVSLAKRLLEMQDPSITEITEKVNRAIFIALWVAQYPDDKKIVNTRYFGLILKFLIRKKMSASDARKLALYHHKRLRLIWSGYIDLKLKKNKTPDDTRILGKLSLDIGWIFEQLKELKEGKTSSRAALAKTEDDIEADLLAKSSTRWIPTLLDQDHQNHPSFFDALMYVLMLEVDNQRQS